MLYYCNFGTESFPSLPRDSKIALVTSHKAWKFERTNVMPQSKTLDHFTILKSPCAHSLTAPLWGKVEMCLFKGRKYLKGFAPISYTLLCCGMECEVCSLNEILHHWNILHLGNFNSFLSDEAKCCKSIFFNLRWVWSIGKEYRD